MKGISIKQIAFIIGAVLIKNWIFQYYGLEYDIFSDEFDILKILLNIGTVIVILLMIYFLDKLLKKNK